MSREIKFRVWDNIDYMSEPFTLYDLQLKEIQFTSDCIVMQYTGIKDKWRKETYEGDIVKVSGTKKIGEYITEIIWDGCGFKLKENKTYIKDYKLLPSLIEVIGNIYEHSHLLNSGQTLAVSDTTMPNL